MEEKLLDSNTQKKQPENKNVNFQLEVDKYDKLQEIGEKLGGMSVSAILRAIVSVAIDRVDESGDPSKIFGFSKKE